MEKKECKGVMYCIKLNTQLFISDPSRISPEWVMELERSRVEAENKLANAALIMAEAAKIQAETLKQLLEIVRIQSGDINAILKTMCNFQKQ